MIGQKLSKITKTITPTDHNLTHLGPINQYKVKVIFK